MNYFPLLLLPLAVCQTARIPSNAASAATARERRGEILSAAGEDRVLDEDGIEGSSHSAQQCRDDLFSLLYIYSLAKVTRDRCMCRRRRSLHTGESILRAYIGIAYFAPLSFLRSLSV